MKSSTSFSSWGQAECTMPLVRISAARLAARAGEVEVEEVPVRLERDVVAQLLPQSLFAQLPHVVGDERVSVAVAHEDGRRLVDVALWDVVHELLPQEQPRGEADDAGNLEGRRQSRDDAHGTTLGEAANENTLRGDAGGDLLLDEGVDIGACLEDPLDVLVGRRAGGPAVGRAEAPLEADG